LFVPSILIGGDNNEEINMKLEDFEKELKAYNPDLAIRYNNPPQRTIDIFPDILKLATITYKGVEICTVPNGEIFDEPNANYGVDFRGDGSFIRHRTRPEALGIVRETLGRIDNNPDFKAQFFGTGEYSDSELRKEVKSDMVVDEIKTEAKEVSDKMLEAGK
jgi:hypothetical protein